MEGGEEITYFWWMERDRREAEMGVMGREERKFQKRHEEGGGEDGRAIMGAKS